MHHFLVVIWAWALFACSVREVPVGALIVDRVDVIGAEKADPDELVKRLATSKTKHALGGLLAAIPVLSYVDALTLEYHTLDSLILDRDLERVRRWYRARGFYDAEVRAGRVVRTEEGHVRVEIVVFEGEPVLLGSVKLDFADWRRAFRVNSALVDRVASYQAEPIAAPERAPRFDEDGYDELKVKLRRALTDNGYAYGTVDGTVNVDVAKRVADVRLTASAGPFCHIAKVTFEGLGEIPERPIREALGIETGDAFSTEQLEQAHFALADFEVFGSVEIEPQVSAPGEPFLTQIPIVVRVLPIKLRGVKLGVGSELGSRFDVHGVAGWEDRNFVGGLRKVTAELRPSLLFFPLGTDNLFDPPDKVHLIPQAELDLGLRQPGLPDPRSSLLANAAAKFYRPRTLFELDQVIVYRELKGELGLERKFRFPYLGGFSFYGSPRLKVQYASPASFVGAPLGGYQDVVIPLLELNGRLDFRRRRPREVEATATGFGAVVSMKAQFAALGSTDDVRLRPELRVYAPLASSVMFAMRWTTGFLFPLNYGDSMREPGMAIARDLQLMAFRGFFSGGPSSNRGYVYGGVGPHEIQSFLSQQASTSGEELLPAGGRGLWELSGEVRFTLADWLMGVVFVDTSDVVRSLSDFRVTHPHVSPGLGFRYLSPVGRVRFDLGVRPPYLQRVGQQDLSESEGGPAPGQTDIPLTFHVAIGESI